MNSIASYLRTALVGFLMGCADVVPGVSGGTIAFICGIYERLLNGIKSFDLTTLRLLYKRDIKGIWNRVPFPFFISLGLGLIVALVSGAKLLEYLLVHHPAELWSFFFGLVLGSIVLLARRTWVWRPADWTAFASAAIGTFVLVGLESLKTPESLLFIFLAGAIAICAMILPGISGSYLLVIMGKYATIIEAVNERDFTVLAVFCAGIATGILSFVRVVSWTLQHYRHITLIILTGVMAGALRTLWPWKETLTTRINSDGETVPLLQTNVMPGSDANLLLALILAIAGCAAVLLIERLAAVERREQETA
jgi:putative membrane protein